MEINIYHYATAIYSGVNEIYLSKNEWKAVQALSHEPRSIDDIMFRIYGHYDRSYTSISNVISSLRNKFGIHFIINGRGTYFLDKDVIIRHFNG